MVWYFVGWIACTTAALGALSLLAIAQTTSASWMVPMRRPAEALAATLPLCVLAFAPIAIFARDIFPWARDLASLSPKVAHAIEHKRAYLSLRPWVARSALYLLSWTAIAELYRRWSVASDRSADPSEIARMYVRQRVLMGLALPWILFTGTFAAFDWLMSLEPEWYSHVYGAIMLAAGGTAAIAFTAIAASARKDDPRMRPAHLHAIGNMLLAAVMFWAYVGFSQILIQWIGDLPHDVTWYLRRTRGPWTTFVIALGMMHFVIPFLLLLVRVFKRAPGALAAIASLVLLAHLLDCAVLVLPAVHFRAAGAPLVLVPLAVAALFGRFRYRRALAVPVHDPLLRAAMRFEMPS